MRALLLISAITWINLLACAVGAGGGGEAAPPRVLEPSRWGGRGMALTVEEKGATTEYDCAHGTIEEPILLAADGTFEVKGKHVPEHGGPVREDERENAQPAVYTGKLQGHQLSVSVRLADRDAVIGTFELQRGARPRLFKCD